MNHSVPKILPMGLIILISSGVSCSKKSDDVVAVQPCAVTKILTTTTYQNGARIVYNTSYTYNSDQTLAMATQVYSSTSPGASPFSATTVINYTYAGGVVSSVSAGDAKSTWTQNNGFVAKISGSSGGASPLLMAEDFTYDSQGRLSSIVYQDNIGGGNKVTNIFAYDASSNLQTLKQSAILGGASQETTTIVCISFDTKNNPYHLLAKAIKQPCFIAGVYGDLNENFYSKNNIITSTGGPVGTNDYEYNDAGFPTKFVRTGLGFTATTLFEYQLCK